MKKRFHLIIIVLIIIIFPSSVVGMSEPNNEVPQKKFDNTKDYHHFYSNPGFVKSLQAICLGTVANNVKDTIDTKDPLASKSIIEETFKQLEEVDISPQCLLQYWKAHTQPTYKFRVKVPGHVAVKWYNAKLCLWYDESFDNLGILDDTIISYRNNPCKNKINYFTSTPDNSCIAIASDDQLFIVLNQRLFPIIAGKRIKDAPIRSLAFSADNTTLFVGFADGLIEGLFIEYDNPLQKKGFWKRFVLKGTEKDPITHLSCAPNGLFFIAVTSNGVVYKWDQHIPDSCCADFFVPTTIKIDGQISKSVISPDSNFIFFQKKDDKEGFLFDSKQELLHKRFGNVVAIAPGNKLIALHNGGLRNCSRNGKSIKFFHIFSDTTHFSQSLDNNHLVDSDICTHMRNGDLKCTEFNTFSDPTLDQLLYKLALEVARENGRKLDLNSLKAYPLFATFTDLEQQILARRMDEYIETKKPEEIAKEFVERHIRPLIYANDSFEGVINEDFLSGYDVPTLEKIHESIKKTLNDWFIESVLECQDLDLQLSRFNDEATQYLITVDNHHPIQEFNDMVIKYDDNLSALKKIKKSGIEDRLRRSESDRYIIVSVKTTIDNLKLEIQKILKGNKLRDLANLIDGEAEIKFGEKKVVQLKDEVKRRIREIVTDKNILSEVCSSADLMALFSEEEVEHLNQIQILEDNKKIIDSFQYPQDGIAFITKLPRMNLAKSTKEELKHRATEYTRELYVNSLDRIVRFCKAFKKNISNEVLCNGKEEITHLWQLAQVNNDILSPEITKPAIEKAQIMLDVLGTKMRVRSGMFLDTDSPSHYQVKIAKKLEAEKMNMLLQNLSPAQRIFTPISFKGLAIDVFGEK